MFDTRDATNAFHDNYRATTIKMNSFQWKFAEKLERANRFEYIIILIAFHTYILYIFFHSRYEFYITVTNATNKGFVFVEIVYIYLVASHKLRLSKDLC